MSVVRPPPTPTPAPEQRKRHAEGGAQAAPEGEATAAPGHAAAALAFAGDGAAAPPPPRGGGGAPLDAGTRAHFEQRFGRDFGGVRVHTGADADRSARALRALAYTAGRDVVFRTGAYAPATPAGKRLLAHELAHVAQQEGARAAPPRAAAAPELGSPADPMEREAERAAARVMAGRQAGPLTPEPPGRAPPVRRDPGDGAGAPDPALAAADRERLAEFEIQLSAEDERELARVYPTGFHLRRETVYVLATGPSVAYGYRLDGVAVEAAAPVAPGVQGYIFGVGKGRSILLSSRGPGGGSVLMDVGVDQRSAGGAERLVRSIESLVSGGHVSPIRSVVFSHTDTDHMNAASRFLRTQAAAGVSIEIATQQLRSAVGQADWQRMNISVSGAQSVVEIQVSGAAGSVHVHRRVVGSMELTEFRSVSAHEGLAQGRRYEKNRTSPVTVVQDLVTGERTIWTGDAAGRQFTEIVNAVGESAFRRLLGAEGRNLRVAEVPHHGGAVTGGPDVRGMLRYLQLAFESSGGIVRLITQTSESFGGGRSAMLGYLDSAGIPVQRVTADPSAEGRSSVTRASGAQLQQVTFEGGTLRSVLEVARGGESQIMSAYQRITELQQLRERAGAMQRATTGAPQLTPSLEQIRTELTAAERGVRVELNRVWLELEAAAGGRQGMRAERDTTRARASIQALGTHLETVNLERARNGLAAHEANLNAYARLFMTAVEMREALRTGRYTELPALRARQRAEIAEARRILGPAEVDAHVRGAWAAMRAQFPPERIEQLNRRLGWQARQSRVMGTTFRVLLAESLGRQMQLNELAESARHGRLPSSRPIPARTRAGAGFLAALEVLRIGLEALEGIEHAMEVAEATERRNRTEGLQTVRWWVEHGAEPGLALVKRHWWSGYTRVSEGMSQTRIREAITSESAPDVPEFERVVVDHVPADSLAFVVHELFTRLYTLADWHAFNDAHPGGPAFRRDGGDGRWGVRLWSHEDSGYRYFHVPTLQEPLEALHRELEIGQEAALARRREERSAEVRTVRDSAWAIGTDRLVWVFNRAGGVREIDFDEVRPRFVRTGRTHAIGRETLEEVLAADMPTYRRVSEHFWRTTTGSWIGASGGGHTYAISRNGEGRALVRPGDLEQPTTGD